MKNNDLIQWMKQMYGKINPNLSLSSRSNPEHLAFLRYLEKEIESGRGLFTPLKELNVVVFDFETTGFSPEKGDQILSIGAVKVKDGVEKEQETFYSLVHFDGELTPDIKELTGLDEAELKNAPSLSEVLIRFYEFVQNDILVAHHASHEKKFLQNANWKAFKKTMNHRIVDTSLVFRIIHPKENLITLDDYCTYAGVAIENRHHALEDAIMTAKLWQIYTSKLDEHGCKNLKDVYEKIGQLKSL